METLVQNPGVAGFKHYPLVNVCGLPLKMAIEIVSFPMKNVNVCQRVSPMIKINVWLNFYLSRFQTCFGSGSLDFVDQYMLQVYVCNSIYVLLWKSRRVT